MLVLVYSVPNEKLKSALEGKTIEIPIMEVTVLEPYDETGPAISYVLKKSRGKGAIPRYIMNLNLGIPEDRKYLSDLLGEKYNLILSVVYRSGEILQFEEISFPVSMSSSN